MMLQRYLLPALLAPAMLFSTLALAVPLGVRDNGSDVDGEFASGDEVDGFLRFGDAADERVVLNYAYAIAEPRIDGAVRVGEKPVPFTVDQTRVIVFLTDYPIPEEARGDIAKIHALANAREFVGLERPRFISARRKPTWTGRLLLGLDAANQVFRPRSGQNNFQVEDFRYRGNEISGEILVDRGLPLFDQNGLRTSEKFTFSVEFELLVDQPPLPTNTLERRDAQNTPQAEIFLSAIDALKHSDTAKFREMTATNSGDFRPGAEPQRRTLRGGAAQLPAADTGQDQIQHQQDRVFRRPRRPCDAAPRRWSPGVYFREGTGSVET